MSSPTAELFECPGRCTGDTGRDTAHSLGRNQENVYAEGETAADAGAEVARVFDICRDSDELGLAGVDCVEKFFADVHPVQEFLLVHQGDNAVVRAGVAVENLGIDLLYVDMRAFCEFLQLIKLGVSRLVHKEYAVHL